MTRITGTDQVLLLLRERLARRTATARPAGTATARTDPGPLDRLRAMSGFDALDDRDRRRAIVHALLVDELGDAVANDAGFQGILDDVLRIIGDLPDGPAMIDRAAAALRG